jgi:hypothetical protein
VKFSSNLTGFQNLLGLLSISYIKHKEQVFSSDFFRNKQNLNLFATFLSNIQLLPPKASISWIIYSSFGFQSMKSFNGKGIYHELKRITGKDYAEQTIK